MLGVFAGLVSVVVQGKGFPYQRYPFLAFGLVLGFRLLSRGWELGGWERLMAATAVFAVSVGVAPAYARKVTSYDRDAQFVSSLTGDLERLPGANGSVQCLDTVGGCVNALYDAGLTQATGYLYDCYAYSGSSEANRVYREGFLRAVLEARPRYVVLSSQFCLAPVGDFGRVERWPELHRVLNSEYQLSRTWESQRGQRWWSRKGGTFSYEIFTRR